VDVDVAERALDPQAALANRRQVPAPGDEGDRGALRGQPGAEVAADGPSPHHRDLHDLAPPRARRSRRADLPDTTSMIAALIGGHSSPAPWKGGSGGARRPG